jgi:hypothetical protein
LVSSAAAENNFHIAELLPVTGLDGKAVDWIEKVTDEQYRK